MTSTTNKPPKTQGELFINERKFSSSPTVLHGLSSHILVLFIEAPQWTRPAVIRGLAVHSSRLFATRVSFLLIGNKITRDIVSEIEAQIDASMENCCVYAIDDLPTDCYEAWANLYNWSGHELVVPHEEPRAEALLHGIEHVMAELLPPLARVLKMRTGLAMQPCYKLLRSTRSQSEFDTVVRLLHELPLAVIEHVANDPALMCGNAKVSNALVLASRLPKETSELLAKTGALNVPLPLAKLTQTCAFVAQLTADHYPTANSVWFGYAKVAEDINSIDPPISAATKQRLATFLVATSMDLQDTTWVALQQTANNVHMVSTQRDSNVAWEKCMLAVMNQFSGSPDTETIMRHCVELRYGVSLVAAAHVLQISVHQLLQPVLDALPPLPEFDSGIYAVTRLSDLDVVIHMRKRFGLDTVDLVTVVNELMDGAVFFYFASYSDSFLAKVELGLDGFETTVIVNGCDTTQTDAPVAYEQLGCRLAQAFSEGQDETDDVDPWETFHQALDRLTGN